MGGLCSKILNSLKHFKGQVREGCFRVCDQLLFNYPVDGGQSFGARRSGGYVLMIIK